MSILGNRVTRREDPRFITGMATFGEDVELPGALHATFVRSVVPHAKITGIDTSGVSAIPGAQAFTAAGLPSGASGTGTEIDLPDLPHAIPGLNEKMTRPALPTAPPDLPPPRPGLNENMPRPVVASDPVRHAGEIVAVVLTEERQHGPDAA